MVAVDGGGGGVRIPTPYAMDSGQVSWSSFLFYRGACFTLYPGHHFGHDNQPRSMAKDATKNLTDEVKINGAKGTAMGLASINTICSVQVLENGIGTSIPSGSLTTHTSFRFQTQFSSEEGGKTFTQARSCPACEAITASRPVHSLAAVPAFSLTSACPCFHTG